MKLVTKLIVVATLATFMFGTINLTWGNAYSNTADDLTVVNQFGVWLDVNDSMAFGWEGSTTTSSFKVGFDGPAGMQMRLGFNPNAVATQGTTLGVSRGWWTSTGDGWGTSLSTAIDWVVVSATPANTGNFVLTMNLGFGF